MKEKINFVGDDGIILPYKVGIDQLGNDADELEKFILACEKMVRADERYTSYVAAVHEAGVLKCSIFGDAPEDTDIHMHHGPMWTLYNVVDIVVRHNMAVGNTFTTFDIADMVLTEHEDNNVMICGLSELPHAAWHMSKIFVHAKSAYGSPERFIERYPRGICKSHVALAKEFKRLCEEQPGSNDNGLFDVYKRLNFKKIKVDKK